MNNIKHILILFVALSCGALSARGQHYTQIELRNIWNRGDNVTGLLRDSITVSNAELFANVEEGDFCNFSDAASQWSAGATAKNIAHRKNLSMIGEFSFGNTSFQDMCGSMFIAPSYYPIDILEFTPGNKSLQRYHFMGGLATEVMPNLNIGLKSAFTSQNYAKFKDVRHYNYRMDFSLAPGVSYRLGEVLIGANYLYTKSSETIRAKEIGTTADPYFAFFDKGMMFGAYQQWEGSGIHLTEAGIDGFPVAENGHGAALQVDFQGAYAELNYKYNEGIIGEKQTFWFSFPSERISAALGYTMLRDGDSHIFLLEAEHEELVSRENVVDDETNNGVTTNVVYGSTQLFAISRLSIEPQYRYISAAGSYLLASVGYHQEQSRATQMYPYVDELDVDYVKASVSGMVPIAKFELRGGLSAVSGSWSDRAYNIAEDVEAGEKPLQMTSYYNIENEFATASRLAASLAARYNISHGFYCEAGAQYLKAFKVKYIGDTRWGCQVKVGYNF